MRAVVSAAAVLAVAWVAVGCPAEEQVVAPTVQIVDIDATLVDETIVAGGSLAFDVAGAGVIVPLRATVVATGFAGGEGITLEAEFVETDIGRLSVTVPWATLTSKLGAAAGQTFEGTLRVVIDDLGELLQGVDELNAVLTFEGSLTPTVEVPTSLEIFVNDSREVAATGMLREGEGASQIAVSGTFIADGGTVRNVDETVDLAWAGARDKTLLRFPAWLFGVEPGQFDGTITPVNDHAEGADAQGEATTVSYTLLASEIDQFTPAVASRGQVISVIGRGFAEPDPERGISTFFRFDGMFTTKGGTEIPMTGDDALQLGPETVPSHTEAKMALRSEIQQVGDKLQLVGLTARPGTFSGAITPVLIEGNTVSYGTPLNGSFTIGPTRQVVYCKFLPAYIDALETFGLRNVEPEIRTRIFEVLARDYDGLNIVFDDVRPDDFVEYSVIEISGPDPNNAGLFGLDNSAGKDTGNIRLNDIVGSQNAESVEQGFYSFGGVFVESFTAFSAELQPSSEVASGDFDAIFGPFMPSLGGAPVSGSELGNSDRQDAIDAAVRAMGSLVGNTLSHEIGHSLGLAFFQEDLFTTSGRFHNELDGEGAIMDSGKFRPFAERAELDGSPAPRFVQRNLNYLTDILPLE